ncbi:MAG: rhodanese-like domain-containing protein [Opitutales bacterium]
MESSTREIPEISPEEAKSKYDRGAHLIDVRTYAEFRAGHADGAHHIEFDEIKEQPGTVAERFPDDRPLLFLCKAGIRAAKAAKTVTGLETRPMFVVTGGTDKWAEADLPMTKETSVMSLERQVRIGAGGLIALGALLALLTDKAVWAVIPLIVGIGLVNAGVTNWCGMGMLMAKMPWNRKQID